MKYAILFAFAAFAFLAQGEAKIEVNELSEIDDRGVITDYLKAKLAAAKEKLEALLSKAQNALKEKIDAVKKKVERLVELLKQKAAQIREKILKATDKMLEKLESSIALIIQEKSINIDGISDCMVMKDNFHQAVSYVIDNTTSCITDKIVEAQSYVTDIHNFTTSAVGAIQEVNKQGIECIRDVKGIKEIVAAVRCVAKVSAKGTVVVGKTVPAVMLKVAKLIKELATLPGSLSFCMPVKTLLTLGQQVEPVVVGIKECIQEKIEESKAPKESFEEIQTEHTIEEEFHNEIPEQEYPEVQSNFVYEAPAKSGPITIQL